MEANIWAPYFLLRDDITFLNFGSFGACPRPIFDQYQQFQLELEQEPVLFMQEHAPVYLSKSRAALGQYLNCAADDVVCVTNPSYGVNIIARSIQLGRGDEVLTTNLEYGACDRTWQYYCDKSGARYIRQDIRFPLASKEAFIEQFMTGISPNTKLIFLSHITSVTGLRLPVEEICAIAKQKGIMTFIDGAHGPGQIGVDLSRMDADCYVGACHKWMMAPKGTSFLYVKKSLQALFDPLVISWGYESDNASPSRYIDYHEMQGTRDLSAFCSIPAAIQFMKTQNWEAVSNSCRELAQENAERFCTLLRQQPLSAIHDDFIAQMYSVRVNTDQPNALHDVLWKKYKIQVPVNSQGGQSYIRYSVQAFNTQADLDRLYRALKAEGV